MGVGHYENFPVASVLLPRRLRRPIAAIYRFARAADDLADEGDAPAAVRLAALAEFEAELERIERGEPPRQPLFAELGAVIAQHRLPLAPFRDLLSAFSQDCIKTRYRDFDELLDYSRRSADPVGRLLLELFEAAEAEAIACSDKICTALQLINFWQDAAIDYAKDRIYLPQVDMERFAVAETELGASQASARLRALLRFQVERTRRLLHQGAALGRMLAGRAGLEIRMVVAGGDQILQKILAVDCDVLARRPVLERADWLAMLVRSLAGDGRIAA